MNPVDGPPGQPRGHQEHPSAETTGFDERPGLAAAFETQARACLAHGSPLYADLCAAAALDLAAPGRLRDLLAPWADARAGDMVALRVLGAAHRLVLERRAPALALWFPSVGGTAPADGRDRQACYAAFLDALSAHSDELPTLLAGAPQTNDAGRAAALAGALAHVAAAYRLPVRVHELGASAGLNLRADRVRLTWPGGATGPVDSPLLLDGAWAGTPLPPMRHEPRVVERVGVDLDPVDVGTPEGRARLTSYVWPDQVERFERLRAAFALAAQVPVRLERGDLLDHLAGLRPQEGSALVVWHSSTWFYLDDEQRRTAHRLMADLGASATRDAPVVQVAREYLADRLGTSHTVVTRWWPVPRRFAAIGAHDGDAVVLGDSPAHGIPVTWIEPYVVALDDV